MSDSKKQSLVIGALIGSAGIFFTKFIGMIYVIPFNALVGEGNMAFYSYAYRTYSYILNICTAGFPYAIATLVAKYMVKEDYRAVLFVRKISFYAMFILGSLSMIGLITVATPLATVVSPIEATPEYIEKVRNCYIIISTALFFVPLLSVFRGFYQGMKELTVYASNQVIEQIARVTFLLVAGFIAVYVFKQDRIVAIYFAVLSAAVSAVVAIAQFLLKDKKVISKLKENINEESGVSTKSILRELVRYAIPYMVVAILGYSYFIVDMLVFNRVMGWRGEVNADLIYGIINMNVDKLTSIPMAVAPGFSIAIVPYVTACYVKGDKEGASRNVTDCIVMALYLALPLTLALLSLATPIYYVMYGGTYAALGGEILAWYSLDGFASTIAPVLTSLTMALNLRRKNMKNVAIGILMKVITVVPLIYAFGYVGALLSSVLGSLAGAFLNFKAISEYIEISYHKILKITSKIFLCLLATQIVFSLGQIIGFKIVDQSRFIALIELAIVGLSGAFTYFALSFYLGIPQKILHKSTSEIIGMFRRKLA
ncbi:MAG: oligosaccharide flippase family protein [Erysipelotrichales bacterium]|nr:oligosaccharide flippase family protein [Erysipelotrichales bacterium]